MQKLFIGNIPHASSDLELRQWVESQGFRVEAVELRDGRIIPAGPDCRVAPDVPIGELFESALRATGYDAAISRNEKSDDN